MGCLKRTAKSERGAERCDALNALQKLDTATEGALNCGGMMGKVAASFGGELILIASHRDANLIEQHFGSKMTYSRRWQSIWGLSLIHI